MRKTEANGDSTIITYDASGRIASISPSGRPAHAFTRTELGLTETYVPPTVPNGGGPVKYAYDASGKPTSVVQASGDTLRVVYDSLGQPTSFTTPQGLYAFSYDLAGRTQSASAPSGLITSYQYAGVFPARTIWRGPVNGEVSIVYDNDFRASTQDVAGAASVNYSYDADGLLTGAGALSLTRSDANGLLLGSTLGVVTTENQFSGLGTLSGFSATATGTSIFSSTLARDSVSRITSRTELVQGVSTLWEYGYDAASRLATVRKNGAAVAQYEYDGNGNRTRSTTSAGIALATVDAQDRVTANGTNTYTYTPNGELARKVSGSDTTRYDYTSAGELRGITLPDGTRIDYLLDADGHRTGKKVNGTLVKGWLYDGDLALVAEVDTGMVGANNKVATRFVFGDDDQVPEYMIRGGQAFRYITDERGSVRLVVNAADGTVAQRLDYDALGRVTENTNPGFQPFGYAGGLYDEQTGLVHFGARDYDPDLARWLSKDPIGFNGGSANLYAYAFGDPINWVDPTGLTGTAAEQGAVADGIGAGAARRVPLKSFHRLVKQAGCFVVEQILEDLADAAIEQLFFIGTSELKDVIYDLELENGKRYVGRTEQKLNNRLAKHIRKKGRFQIQRIFSDLGGLSIADAEATILEDVLRKLDLTMDDLGKEGNLIDNKVKPGNGTSKLCKP